MQNDTIVAIATPPGRGGVGIARLSGPLAYEIALKLSNYQSLTPRIVNYCSLKNRNNEIIDTGLVIFLKRLTLLLERMSWSFRSMVLH